MNTISTLVMSKTAWGSKQAKEAFGIKLPKSLNPLSAGKSKNTT